MRNRLVRLAQLQQLLEVYGASVATTVVLGAKTEVSDRRFVSSDSTSESVGVGCAWSRHVNVIDSESAGACSLENGVISLVQG